MFPWGGGIYSMHILQIFGKKRAILDVKELRNGFMELPEFVNSLNWNLVVTEFSLHHHPTIFNYFPKTKVSPTQAFPNHTKEKAMAPHSSTIAWKIPWTEEPGRLQSMGSLRIGHDWATSLSLFTFMHWRRKWQPTPVFLPGKSQGRGSLVGCRRWGRTELDTTEAT